MIRLSRTAVRTICEHGARSYGDEACGVLYGNVSSFRDVKSVHRAEPLSNARSDQRHRRFLITPADYARAEATAARNGWSILGFYHSHPDHPAIPSSYDLAHAFPFLSYVIVSVHERLPGELRSFVMTEDRRQFLEETVEFH